MTTRIHRAWLVAGVTFLVLLASAAFRSSVGVMIVPFEDEFGWTRSATSLAVSVNLVVYGVTAPFAAALMERFGIKRIAAIALGLIAAGTGLTLVMTLKKTLATLVVLAVAGVSAVALWPADWSHGPRTSEDVPTTAGESRQAAAGAMRHPVA